MKRKGGKSEVESEVKNSNTKTRASIGRMKRANGEDEEELLGNNSQEEESNSSSEQDSYSSPQNDQYLQPTTIDIQHQPEATNSTLTPKEQPVSGFECNICFELASNPVVSQCGHLFCWPCVGEWMEHQTSQNCPPQCPVCKSSIQHDQLIPVYCRGRETPDEQHAFHTPRPPPKRTDIPPRRGGSGFISWPNSLDSPGAAGFNFQWRWNMFPGFQFEFSNFQQGTASHQQAPQFHPIQPEPRRLQVVLANFLLLLSFFILYFVLYFEFSY